LYTFGVIGVVADEGEGNGFAESCCWYCCVLKYKLLGRFCRPLDT